MTNSPRNTLWLIIGISGVSLLGWLVTETQPAGLMLLITFFSLIFLSCFSLTLFVANNTRRAMLCAIGVTLFLVLRSIGLKNILYPILLVASLLSLELVTHKR